MLKLACRITGDNYQMLKSETTPSRKKVITLALAVFVPTIMWFANGYLIVSEVMEKSFFAALFTGLVAALLIFLIEKLVVMSNGGWLLVVFRVILAFLVAAIGSVFLDEVIFVKDINQQLVINKEKMTENAKEAVKSAHAQEFATQEGLVQQKYASWQQTQLAAEHEADGSAGSGIRGVHAITRLKLENAVVNQNDYLLAKGELDAIQAHIIEEQEKEAARIASSFEDKALLNRIKAMFDLVLTDGFMLAFYLLVTAILFTLEFLVIIFKVTMGKTNYERRLELIEEIGQKRMERVRQNDLKHFDSGRISPEYRQAYANLGKSKVSLFN